MHDPHAMFSRSKPLLTRLQQLVNQRFRLVCGDADVAAKGQRTFARVQDGLQFLERR